MKVIYNEAFNDNGKKNLEVLMNNRSLTESQMAKMLGVEERAVGAWLSGKRAVSAKYREKIDELLNLPKASDLLIAPAVNHLSKQIQQVFDVSDVAKIADALAETLRVFGTKLREFSAINDDSEIQMALRHLLGAFDSNTIVCLNQDVAAILAERTYISSISAEEFAKKCVELSKSSDLDLEYDSNHLYAHYFIRLDSVEVMEEAKNDDSDTNNALPRDDFEETARAFGESTFSYTAFEKDWGSDQWVNADTYCITYYISLEHPQFKDSLRLLMDRCFSSRKLIG